MKGTLLCCLCVQVLSWGGDVMKWLYMTVQHSPEQRTLVVEAFAAWVRLGLLYEQELPQQEVQGLLSLTFQCLLHSSDGKGSALHDCERALHPGRSQHLMCCMCLSHRQSSLLPFSDPQLHT